MSFPGLLSSHRPEYGRVLVVCPQGDWWAFLFNHMDDQCPAHGWLDNRTPTAGTDVSGPCLGCGAPMVLQAYNPDRHTTEDLRCPGCRGAS